MLDNMKNILKRVVTFFTDRDRRLNILDDIYGSSRSIEEKRPVDINGNPLPWFTYPAIEYLSRLDFSKCNIFEFGCGYGTSYWGNRCKSITSIEDNSEWYEQMKIKTKRNKKINLIYADNREDYINSIVKTKKKFDVVIIDGVFRDGSTLSALKCLKKNALIILDNSDWYANSARILRKAGFTQVDFDGFGPGNTYTWVTSIFFRDRIEFQHTDSIKNNYSKGGYKKTVASK